MASAGIDRFLRHISLRLAASTRRRTLLRGAALSAAFVGWLAETEAAKKKPRCKPNGTKCAKKSKTCKAGNCLKPSFTIAAEWTNANSDHDTFLFLPHVRGAPVPYIDYSCNSVDTNDGALYPFAFVDGDASGPGDEVTTIRKLLGGTYEYWIELSDEAPAGDLDVILRNKGGEVVRSWTSPANPEAASFGWHVFDINGKTGSVTSVDELVEESPLDAHPLNDEACPA